MSNDNYWLKDTPIAHRGLWNETYPENTMGAFGRAIEYRYPIELDVQMLADGNLVVFHDWSLERMTGQGGVIEQLTYEDITSLAITETDQKIPLLRDVLALIDGQVPILIEMKNRSHDSMEYTDQLRKTIGEYTGEYALSSFNVDLLEVAKNVFPERECGQNFSDYPSHGILCSLAIRLHNFFVWKRNSFIADFYVFRASMVPQSRIFRKIQESNKMILTWGIASEGEFVKKQKYFDNVIFDGEVKK